MRICEQCGENPARKERKRCHACERTTVGDNPARPDLDRPTDYVRWLQGEVRERERAGTLHTENVQVGPRLKHKRTLRKGSR